MLTYTDDRWKKTSNLTGHWKGAEVNLNTSSAPKSSARIGVVSYTNHMQLFKHLNNRLPTSKKIALLVVRLCMLHSSETWPVEKQERHYGV